MWILILTIMIDTSYAGVSGVEAVKFNYQSSCEKAGEKWLSAIDNKYGDKSRSFYMCAKG